MPCGNIPRRISGNDIAGVFFIVRMLDCDPSSYGIETVTGTVTLSTVPLEDVPVTVTA